MRTRRWGAAVAALAVAAAACGGGGGKSVERSSGAHVDESTPYLRSDGPLHAPVLAGVHPDGGLRHPAPAFTTADTEANAFVALGGGVEEEAKLTVAWYRLTGEGREHLFSHEIAVREHGRARSQAIAPSGLPSGIYETVATLGERQVRTPWIVKEGDGGEPSLGGASAAAESSSDVDPGVASFDDPIWDSPSSPPPPADGACRFGTVSVDAIVELSVFVMWGGQCATITIGASVMGPPETLRSFSAPEQVSVIGTPQTAAMATSHVCSIPGGSDMPGTVVKAVVTDSGGASATAEEVLEDLGPLLQAGLDSTPAPGTRVRAGDTIRLEALALVFSPALGVKTLYVNANDELIESVGNASGSTEPIPCDQGRLVAYLRTQYRVPDDPPPVVELCATGVGFDGTESHECIRYYTGEVWEGTVAGQVTRPGCSPLRVPLTGVVNIVVRDDGTVTGSATEKWGGCSIGLGTVPRAAYEYQITGRRTADAFELSVSGTGVRKMTIPITGTRATVTFDEGSAGHTAKITYTVECVTCG